MEKLLTESQITSSDKVFIKASATWCGPCSLSKPVIEELAKENPDYKFFELDIDEARPLAEKLQIQGVPTFLVFENGVLKTKHVGLTPKAELQKSLV
jgi:thioredoxin 1